MEAGGAAAFLHDLMHYDYSDVSFASPPMTEGLDEQIRLGFTPEEKWLEAVLAEGCFLFVDGNVTRKGAEWPETGGLEVAKEMVVESFRQYVSSHKAPPTPQLVGTFLGKHVLGLQQVRRREFDGRNSYWVFPPLEQVRKAFIQNHPGYKFADDPEDVPGVSPEATGEVVPMMRRSRY